MARDYIRPRPRYERRMKNPLLELVRDICQKAAIPLIKEMGNVLKTEMKDLLNEEGVDFDNLFKP